MNCVRSYQVQSMEVNKEAEFLKKNSGFFQADNNVVDNFDDERLEKHLANTRLKKVFDSADLVETAVLKKLSNEVVSDFVVYSDEELSSKKAFDFYKVGELSHSKLRSVTSVKKLTLAQRVGLWVNIFRGNPLTSDTHAFYLVKGGMSVSGIPDPVVNDTPESEEGESNGQIVGPKIPNMIGEELILEMLKWDDKVVTLKWFEGLGQDKGRLFEPFLPTFATEQTTTLVSGSNKQKFELFRKLLSLAREHQAQGEEEEKEEEVLQKKKSTKRDRVDIEDRFIVWAKVRDIREFERAFPVVSELQFEMSGSLKDDYIRKRRELFEWFKKKGPDADLIIAREAKDLFRMILKAKGLDGLAKELTKVGGDVTELPFGRELIGDLASSKKIRDKELKKAMDAPAAPPERRLGQNVQNYRGGGRGSGRGGGRGRLRCYTCNREGHRADQCFSRIQGGRGRGFQGQQGQQGRGRGAGRYG